jgi:hypothetical protein
VAYRFGERAYIAESAEKFGELSKLWTKWPENRAGVGRLCYSREVRMEILSGLPLVVLSAGQSDAHDLLLPLIHPTKDRDEKGKRFRPARILSG